MNIELLKATDYSAVVELWNKEAVKYLYKPLTEAEFVATFIEHEHVDEACLFVAKDEQGLIIGFAAGVTSTAIPLGEAAGYITTVIMTEGSTDEQIDRLIEALEARFKACGKTQADVLFFNPVKLVWTIPSAPQHEHNNAPGISKSMPLYSRLIARGYADRATQCGMYLSLANYEVPERVTAKQEQAAKLGYSVTMLDKKQHHGIEELVEALDNAAWKKEIPYHASQGDPIVIAEKEGLAVGFAGPVIRQENGRAFFCGIGVHPEHEGHGLGTVLFYRLLEAFKLAGCEYVSLFTGEANPAINIYLKAGFTIEHTFSILRRELD